MGRLSHSETAQLRSVGVHTDAERRARDAYLRALDDDAPLDMGTARGADRQQHGNSGTDGPVVGRQRWSANGGQFYCSACGGRKRKAPQSYDEVRRRKARRTEGPRGYMERGGRSRAGSKRTAIVMGGAALERVVAGRYEWRDSGLAPVRGERKRYWEDEHEPVHRTQRPVQRRRPT